MMFTRAAKMVQLAMGDAIASGRPFVPIVLLHIQDEAELRLRSFAADRIAVPARGRASKVQQHVATLFTSGGQTPVPTELEALGDKTAATLATSFENLVRRLAERILPPEQDGEKFVIFTHILVGDGISTNEYAAKRLWSMFLAHRLSSKGIYR